MLHNLTDFRNRLQAASGGTEWRVPARYDPFGAAITPAVSPPFPGTRSLVLCGSRMSPGCYSNTCYCRTPLAPSLALGTPRRRGIVIRPKKRPLRNARELGPQLPRLTNSEKGRLGGRLCAEPGACREPNTTEGEAMASREAYHLCFRRLTSP